MNFKALLFSIYISKKDIFWKSKVQKYLNCCFLVIYCANVKEGTLEKSTWRHERLHSKACRYSVEPSKTIDAVQLWRFLDTCRMHIMHPCRYNSLRLTSLRFSFFRKLDSSRFAAVQFWSTGFYICTDTHTRMRAKVFEYCYWNIKQ